MNDQKPFFGRKEIGKQYIRRKGVYAIIFDEQREMLAVMKTPKGYFLAGGMEGEESLEECLQREALEELGHDILIKKYIGNAEKYYITQQDQTPMIADSYFYLAELAEWMLDPIEEDHELEWIPISEAQELLHHEHQAWAVAQAFEPK
ncbi:NUDIX domain-containing protein [Fictibacillus sp. B-59209]|uniref:NUDIX domain-containing protein n=1 Tax=Fictibacillus sp. B-59209 TaxID=3024873 RepID=UPI002E2353C4|nr:NUDIX domain-containing protein [Fictibacillus sp. B-59209]